MVLAKPWEKNGASPVIADAIADQTHAPWKPKPGKVPERIKQAVTDKRRKQERRTLPPESIFNRQEFAKHYLIDCDHRNAAIRMGADPEDAARIGRDLLNCPVTLAAIQAYSARIEKDKIVSRERVLLGLLEEANYHGLGSSHSARVAAWTRIAAIIGADKPEKEDDPLKKVRGGVMMIPMAATIEQWEQAAVGSQAQLKAAVRQ